MSTELLWRAAKEARKFSWKWSEPLEDAADILSTLIKVDRARRTTMTEDQ
jgi:hypothetical protein